MTGGLTVRVEHLSHGFRLVPTGEIDISNVEELRSAIDRCLDYRPVFLQIDFREVTFVAWAAVEVLLYAKGRCRELRVTCSLSESRHVQRLLHAIGCSSIEQLEWRRWSGIRDSEAMRIVNRHDALDHSQPPGLSHDATWIGERASELSMFEGGPLVPSAAPLKGAPRRFEHRGVCAGAPA